MNPCEVTPRQRDILDMMSRGLHNKQMARELGISPRTVEVHRAKAMRCIGASTAIHAALIWSTMKHAAQGRAQIELHTHPAFSVLGDGFTITRNGAPFATCATHAIAEALALTLDAGQIVFGPTVPQSQQSYIATILWPDPPPNPPSGGRVGWGATPRAPAQPLAQPLESMLSDAWEA